MTREQKELLEKHRTRHNESKHGLCHGEVTQLFELIDELSRESQKGEDLFVGEVNGVRYYKNGFKGQK